MRNFKESLKRFIKSEEAMGTVEVILIIAVVIIIALLFRDWIIAFVKNLMTKADKKANTIFD